MPVKVLIALSRKQRVHVEVERPKWAEYIEY